MQSRVMELDPLVATMMSDNCKKFQSSTLNGYWKKVDLNKKLNQNSDLEGAYLLTKYS